MNKQDVHERLIEIAKAESASDTLDKLHEERNKLFDALIAPIDDAIAALQDNPKTMRAVLKQDVLDYVADTGDTDIHDLIDFRRKTRWQYDKDAALEYALDCDMDHCIRIKSSLDVRAFEKELDGGNDGFDAEKVATPEVAIKKLSHLLD